MEKIEKIEKPYKSYFRRFMIYQKNQQDIKAKIVTTIIQLIVLEEFLKSF